jgi:hypothetical protein
MLLYNSTTKKQILHFHILKYVRNRKAGGFAVERYRQSWLLGFRHSDEVAERFLLRLRPLFAKVAARQSLLALQELST